jgi:hypothetical protein
VDIRGRRYRTAPVIVIGLALFDLDRSADAASVCAKLQYKIAAAGAKAKAACYAKAAGSGAVVDTTCVANAEEKLARKWVKAGENGDCPTAADAATAQGLVDAFLAGLVGVLEPPTVSYCCATGTSCLAGPVMDASGCAELLGTLGLPGSICDGATGTCVAPPGTGGPCCALPQYSVCMAGPGGDPATCVDAGGFDVPNAVCLPTGACAFP